MVTVFLANNGFSWRDTEECVTRNSHFLPEHFEIKLSQKLFLEVAGDNWKLFQSSAYISSQVPVTHMLAQNYIGPDEEVSKIEVFKLLSIHLHSTFSVDRSRKNINYFYWKQKFYKLISM